MGLVKRGCRTWAGARSHRALRFGLDFTVTRSALEPSNKHCQVGWTWAVGEGGIQIGSKRGVFWAKMALKIEVGRFGSWSGHACS